MDAREKSNRLIGLLGTAQKALVECMDFISDDLKKRRIGKDRKYFKRSRKKSYCNTCGNSF